MTDQPTKSKKSRKGKIRPKLQPLSPGNVPGERDDSGLGFGDILTTRATPTTSPGGSPVKSPGGGGGGGVGAGAGAVGSADGTRRTEVVAEVVAEARGTGAEAGAGGGGGGGGSSPSSSSSSSSSSPSPTASPSPPPPPVADDAPVAHDLTPRPPPAPWTYLLSCCRAPEPDGGGPSSEELMRSIGELRRRNEELEARLTALADEKSTLEDKLQKEMRRKRDAKDRRKTLKTKLATMTERLKSDFGDDFDGLESSSGDKEASPSRVPAAIVTTPTAHNRVGVSDDD